MAAAPQTPRRVDPRLDRSPDRRPDRRRLLTGALGAAAAVGLSACSTVDPAVDRLRDLVAGGEDAAPAPRVEPPSDPADPDVRLAVEVMLVSEAAATALENWASRPGRGAARLRRIAREAAATHTRHAALVGGAVPAGADPGNGRLSPALISALESPSGTLKSVVRIEELAQAGLREAALSARSGPFASLLASMVAASAQHSAQLRGVASGAGAGA